MSMNDEAAKRAAVEKEAAKAKADAEARENAANEAGEFARKAELEREQETNALRDRVARLEAELAEKNAPVPESKNPFGTITLNAKNQVVEG